VGHSDVSDGRVQRTQAFVRNSFTGSVWTIVSRGTGLVQSIAVATVLGATYLGNTYQAINALPNIVYYQLLAGSLFASILVPPLVAKRNEGDAAASQTLASGFFGTLLLAGAGLSLALVLVAPLMLRAFTSGVSDPAIAARQQYVGLVFLLLFVPQIVLYITAGTGAAVMNAHGRFALAAGAPALENLGMIATLLTCAILFGTVTGIANVTTPELLLLGLGTTASVGLHAAAQWKGARSNGVTLVPRAGWRDPEVRRALRRVLPTLGYTGLAAAQTVVVLAIANRLAGGLVGFQLSLNFFFLPIAIVTWPIARSMLPSLSALIAAGQDRDAWEELCRAVRLASFVVIPIAVAYVALSKPISNAIAIGAMQQEGGDRLIAASLSALGLGVIAETWFILGTYAFYAREDARSPLRSMVLRVSIAVAGMSAALFFHSIVVLLIVGISMSLGTFVGSFHLWRRLRSASGHGAVPIRPIGRATIASLAMAIPVTLTAWALSAWIGGNELGQVLVVIAASLVGATTYLIIQAAWGSPEVALLRLGTGALRLRRVR
jgi:murein biosynthesis integral membrane protein MurJ